jgi:hypothetical protein
MVTKEDILGALSGVRELPAVRKALSLIDLKESKSAPIQGGAFFEPATTESRATIIIFPNATTDDVVRAFGKALFAMMNPRKKQRCEWYMTTVTDDWVSVINLNWPDKDNFPTYEKLIVHHNSTVERLCTMMVCNAFIANKVPRADSYGIDLCDSPYVQDLVNKNRYYPLYSLVSAYAPHFLGNFHEFFADSLKDFQSVLRTDLREALILFRDSVLS